MEKRTEFLTLAFGDRLHSANGHKGIVVGLARDIDGVLLGVLIDPVDYPAQEFISRCYLDEYTIEMYWNLDKPVIPIVGQVYRNNQNKLFVVLCLYEATQEAKTQRLSTSNFPVSYPVIIAFDEFSRMKLVSLDDLTT